MSEVTDSLTIVVSEETGGISVTKNGELYRDLNQESFKAMLTSELVVENIKSTSSSIFNWRGKKNG